MMTRLCTLALTLALAACAGTDLTASPAAAGDVSSALSDPAPAGPRLTPAESPAFDLGTAERAELDLDAFELADAGAAPEPNSIDAQHRCGAPPAEAPAAPGVADAGPTLPRVHEPCDRPGVGACEPGAYCSSGLWCQRLRDNGDGCTEDFGCTSGYCQPQYVVVWGVCSMRPLPDQSQRVCQWHDGKCD